MKHLTITVLLLLYLGPVGAQVNVQLLHQLVDDSKAEHSRQQEARNRQAVTTANEDANRSQMQKLKDKYRQLKERFHSVGLAIDAGQVAIEATPLVDRIILYQQSIIDLAAGNPILVPLAVQTEIDLADQARRLANFIIGLSLSIGDLGQMKASDRKLLFGHALDQLRIIEGTSRGLALSMSVALARLGSPRFNDFLEKDRKLVEDIMRNYRTLNGY